MFSCVLVALFIVPIVSAQNIIGVSPGTVSFQNVLRGGYSERPISVTFTSEEPVLITFETRGDIAKWVSMSVQNLTVSKDHPGSVMVLVEPPVDIPNGNYSGFIRVNSETIDKSSNEGHATGAVIAVIDVATTVEIIDTELTGCKARNFLISSVEKGDPLIYQVNVLNEGNIRINPRITIDIWDQEQVTLMNRIDVTGETILPTQEKTLSFEVSSRELPIDQYWTIVSAVDCYSAETLTFDVLEPGTLKAEGTLVSLVGKVWSRVGETIPVVATFKNIGEKEVIAQFRGKIQSKERQEIIQILESEKISVPSGELTNFTFLFTPEKADQYIISGRIFYDTKRTFESSTVLNVTKESSIWSTFFFLILYALIIAAIVFFFFKIRNERRRIKNYL